jgi:hypothetical protein
VNAFDTLLLGPATEPIEVPTYERPATPPAILHARANTVRAAIILTTAVVTALSPLPRFESLLTGITIANTALWALRKIGGRS